MRGSILWGWLMAAALFVPPLLLSGQTAAVQEKPVRPASQSTSLTGQSQTAHVTDAQVTLRVKTGDAVEEMTLSSYLPGVVRGEMPPTFEVEALKAQAVAERTFALRQIRSQNKDAHPDADVCTDPNCCSAWLGEESVRARWGASFEEWEARIDQAVQATDGQILLYDGAPILAVFHSSSGGTTASSGDVWTSDLPYLKSVESPESADTVPNYYSVVTVSADTFRETIRAACPQADFSADAASWVGAVTNNASGRVEQAQIGGVTISGTALRQLFSLRSACFTISYEPPSFLFRVTGYGHGVGMSQYGANELARQGKTWEEILLWYYTGVTVGYMT